MDMERQSKPIPSKHNPAPDKPITNVDKFTWKKGDLRVFGSEDEMRQWADSHNARIKRY